LDGGTGNAYIILHGNFLEKDMQKSEDILLKIKDVKYIRMRSDGGICGDGSVMGAAPRFMLCKCST
jgi:hypothetical protein